MNYSQIYFIKENNLTKQNLHKMVYNTGYSLDSCRYKEPSEKESAEIREGYDAVAVSDI